MATSRKTSPEAMSVRYSEPSSPWPNELIEWPDASSRRGVCVDGPLAVSAQIRPEQ